MSDPPERKAGGAGGDNGPAANGGRETNGGSGTTPLGGLLRLVRGRRRQPRGDEVRSAIGELIEDSSGRARDEIADDERQLIRNILTLHRLTVHDVMVPRADIVAVEVSTSLPGLIELLSAESHSRLPVYRESLDDVLGMVHIKDILPFWSSRRAFKLEKVTRKVLFAAPSMNVLDLLGEMRDTRIHLALVVDEFGGIDGLVTIEDLVEEIVGEIEDEHDTEEPPQIVEDRPGTALADARTPIEDFEDLYGPILTEDEREDVETLGGLVFYLANRVPLRGELIQHPSGIVFEVLDADPRRIRRLRLRHLPPRRTRPDDDTVS